MHAFLWMCQGNNGSKNTNSIMQMDHLLACKYARAEDKNSYLDSTNAVHYHIIVLLCSDTIPGWLGMSKSFLVRLISISANAKLAILFTFVSFATMSDS